MRKHSDFEVIDMSGVLPQLELPEGSMSMRLRPDVHHTDGMFLSLLKRIA